jgi:outer membrane biosynthesis protein TonB
MIAPLATAGMAMTGQPTKAGVSERQALIGAGIFHLILLAALSIGWQMQQAPLAPAEEMIPVEIVEIAAAPRVREAPAPSIKAAPQDSTAAPTPPTPSPPAPTVADDTIPLPEAKPAPKPTPPTAKARPDAKPLDTSLLSNLIDKALPKAKVKPLDTSDLATKIAAATPKTARIDPRAAATLAQAIRAQVAPCWNPPIGGADVKKMTVVIRADYGRDGRVIGTPTVASQTGATAANTDYARAFAETARRAVLRCSPLTLPPKLYDLWKSAEINFDPESMT